MPVSASDAIRILAVYAVGEDRSSLRRIFRSFDWRGQFLGASEEPAAVLEKLQPDVVLAGCESWRDVVRAARELPAGPPVIVTSRFADERMWAEVLNLGGFDLLCSPFLAQEVHDVVNMARRSRGNARAALAASAA